MKKLLIVVDMQRDFVDGSLGTPEATAIIPRVVEKIRNWDGEIIATMDTHGKNYLQTAEGAKLPVEHCIEGTEGYEIHPEVLAALGSHAGGFEVLKKITFGSTDLPERLRGAAVESVELIGLCTDICVVSNALLLKTFYPEMHIAVDASCCAGVTPESHKAALLTMQMCQIDLIGE